MSIFSVAQNVRTQRQITNTSTVQIVDFPARVKHDHSQRKTSTLSLSNHLQFYFRARSIFVFEVHPTGLSRSADLSLTVSLFLKTGA